MNTWTLSEYLPVKVNNRTSITFSLVWESLFAVQLKIKQKTTCRPLRKRLDADQEITYNEKHVFYMQTDVYCGKQHV